MCTENGINIWKEPIFNVQLQKQEGESKQGLNELAPILTSSKSPASKVCAERNGGEGSSSVAASVIQRDLESDDVSFNVHAFPKVNHLICTSINEKRNFNLELKKEDKELISKDNFGINSYMAGFHVTKFFQGAFLCEHRERIDETIVENDDLYLKRDFECFREQYSEFVSVEPVCHDKVSSTSYKLEPCSTYREISQPRLFTCMETPQKSKGCPSSSISMSFLDRNLDDLLNSKGCPSSSNTTNFRNRSSGYRVREIVQSSKLKATNMVDAAIKVMSSIKVGEDAYAMIGEALDLVGIWQVGDHSRISRLKHCSYQQNGGPGSCHQDLSCNPAEFASIVHSFNSTVPTFSQNYSRISPKLISACVAALLMIQECSDSGLAPAEAMEILEHAARDLHPQYSENLHIYREIEELMGIIKTQVLSLVRTPASNLQV